MFFHRQRLDERTAIALDGGLRIGDQLRSVTFANASPGGLLALLSDPPHRGTNVTVLIGEAELAGQVRWRGASRCGIALKERIDVKRLVEGRAVPVSFVPENHLDSYRGPSGIFRSITSEGPLSMRFGNALLLLVAVASAAFVLSRLGMPLAHGAPAPLQALVGPLG